MASKGINKVILVGNLGQDPEVRYMPNGGAVTNISIATSESWKDKNTGQMQERTEWHRVALFGKLAEVAGEYLRKGSQVYIEGQLQTRKWQDQQGQDRYTTEVVVQGYNGVMQMLGGRAGNDAGGYSQQPQGGGFAPQQAAHQGQQQGGFQPQQGGAPQQGGFAPQQSAPQHNAPQQSAGFAPQQGGFAPKQPAPAQGQPGGAANPMEPPIDFDDDIPF